MTELLRIIRMLNSSVIVILIKAESSHCSERFDDWTFYYVFAVLSPLLVLPLPIRKRILHVGT